MIKPSNDRILIKVIKGSDEKLGTSGLLLNKEKLHYKKAEVLAIGEGVAATGTAVGDIIYLLHNRGIEIEGYHLIFQNEILAYENKKIKKLPDVC